jgi:hypothetical protein
MRSNERRPAWQHDVRWLAALLLIVVVALAAAASSVTRLTAAVRVEPIAFELLTLAVGPADEVVRIAPTAAGYQAGTPLALLPGAPVLADATEIPTFDVDAAVARIAGVLAERYVASGGAATWQTIDDAEWRGVLEGLDAAVLRPLLVLALRGPLFAVGLADGSRAANWPLQAQQNPGQQVQPLVGVFVTVPPLALQGRSALEVGELVVAELAEVVANDGADAARALITNPNVAAALETALSGPVRDALHGALAAVVRSRSGEIEARLADARAVLAGSTPTSDPWAGLVDPTDLGRLDSAERRERVVRELAQRAVLGGSAAVLAALPESGVRERVSRSAAVIDLLDRGVHRQARTWAWTLGAVALLLTVIVVLTADGFGRATWPGFAWLLGAGPGLWAAWVWSDMTAVAAWPASPALEGAFVALVDTVRLVLAQLAQSMGDTVLWAHLVPAGVGAAFVVIGATGWLAAQLRPSRRSRF